MVRYGAPFEVANSTRIHTLFSFPKHVLMEFGELEPLLSHVPSGLPVVSVNKSKFDSRMNAAAYMLVFPNYIRAPAVRQGLSR